MLVIDWQDGGFRRFARAIAALGKAELPRVMVPALNRTGDMARTQVRRTLTGQTGLKRRTIVKAVHVDRAGRGRLVYAMRAKGGDVSLKYFAARETRSGVSAKPFGKRKIFPGTFTHGGVFPTRVPLNMSNQVFKRSGLSRLPIEKVKSGVVIPAEMVKGATAEAFQSTVRRVLPERVEHEIRRMTGAAFIRR